MTENENGDLSKCVTGWCEVSVALPPPYVPVKVQYISGKEGIDYVGDACEKEHLFQLDEVSYWRLATLSELAEYFSLNNANSKSTVYTTNDRSKCPLCGGTLNSNGVCQSILCSYRSKACRRGHFLDIRQSSSGFFIGTYASDGAPYCRLSAEYWQTKEDAVRALISGTFTTREHEFEIMMCNETKGCLL